MTNDIRRFLTILENNNFSDSASLMDECMDTTSTEWYNQASHEMVNRIKSGEYPIDVINDLARQYSWKNGGTYESFAFARDALDRRAWEMGLRYTDDPHHTSSDGKGYHDTLISSTVTEEVDESDTVLEELINEAGLINRIIAKMLPNSSIAAEVESDNNFKTLARTLSNKFKQRFGFGDKRNLTFENATRMLNQLDIHPKFIEKVRAEFIKKFPGAKVAPRTPLDEKMIKAFFVAMSAEIMLEGNGGNIDVALASVDKDNYKPEGSNETPPANDKSTDQDSSETPNKKPGYRTIKSSDDVDNLTKKALSGTDSLTPDEIHDLGVLITKLRKK